MLEVAPTLGTLLAPTFLYSEEVARVVNVAFVREIYVESGPEGGKVIASLIGDDSNRVVLGSYSSSRMARIALEITLRRLSSPVQGVVRLPPEREVEVSL